MKAEKNGFVLVIEGSQLKISNQYGVLECEDISMLHEAFEDFAEKLLDEFIDNHSVAEKSSDRCIKRVAYDKKSKEYLQLQAVLPEGKECWMLQKFDNELVYMGEICSKCRYKEHVLGWMCTNFDIESCFVADVYRNSALDDCTNNGISKNSEELYILSAQKGPFEPQDIRECVYIERREVCGREYIDCKPAYRRNRWYMSGGNFLYSPDSRFVGITGSDYPIPIHDRCEEK